jgi:hypothetical protein
MKQLMIPVSHLDGIQVEVIKGRIVKMPVIFSKFNQRQALGRLVNILIRGPRTAKKDQ